MRTIAATFAAFFIFAGVAQAAGDPLQSVLQSRYDAMKTAMHARDDKAMGVLFAEDFKSVDVFNNKADKKGVIDEVKQLPDMPQKESVTTILSVKADKDKAVVHQRYDMKNLEPQADGSRKHVEMITESTDEWVSAKGVWLMQKTTTESLDYKIDGKLVYRKVRGGI